MKKKCFLCFIVFVLAFTYAEGIGDPSLVSYWKFDEISGAVIDSAGDRNGTIYGNVTQGQSGKFGNAASFSDAGAYVDMGASGSVSPATIEAWVNPNDNSGFRSIVQINTHYNETWCDCAFYLYNGRLYPYRSGQGNAAVALNQWTHIAMVNDGSQTKLYINGVLDATVTTHSVWNDGWSFIRVGGGYAGDGESFSGLIDDVAIFNRALSASEIQSHATLGIEQTYLNAASGIVPEPTTFVLFISILFGIMLEKKLHG